MEREYSKYRKYEIGSGIKRIWKERKDERIKERRIRDVKENDGKYERSGNIEDNECRDSKWRKEWEEIEENGRNEYRRKKRRKRFRRRNMGRKKERWKYCEKR